MWQINSRGKKKKNRKYFSLLISNAQVSPSLEAIKSYAFFVQFKDTQHN